MQGHIMLSVMALMFILSTSAIYATTQSFFAVNSSLLLRDAVQLDMLTNSVLAQIEQTILQLDVPIIAHEGEICSPPCVLLHKDSHYFLQQNMTWWFADHNHTVRPITLQAPDIKAAFILEHLKTEGDPLQGVLTYLRGTIVMQHVQGSERRMQVYYEHLMPNSLDYQQSAAELATLKSGRMAKVRRLALRRDP